MTADAAVEIALIQWLRAGDAGALDGLMEAFASRVYRLAYGITRCASDAEEVVQDVFLTLFKKADTFEARSAVWTWIYRITTNAALSKRRSGARRRHEISLDEILPTFHEDGRYADPIVAWSAELADPAVQGELRTVLTAALQELPDHYRAVIILHDVEALSMAEVSDCLAITLSTAKARVHRARLFLRQRLAGFMSGASCGVEMCS
jgi:RNA polymerase sigma-70 factor (ECF subfamily)